MLLAAAHREPTALQAALYDGISLHADVERVAGSFGKLGRAFMEIRDAMHGLKIVYYIHVFMVSLRIRIRINSIWR